MPRRTQEERSNASRAKIIDGALEVLSDVGFERMTFSRIQEVSGVSRGLVHYHFGTKEVLVEELVESVRNRYQADELDEIMANLTGLQRLKKMVDRYLARLEEDPRPAKVMIQLGMMSKSENPKIRGAILRRYSEMREELAGFIRDGIADGSIERVDSVDAAASTVQGLLRGIALQYIVDPRCFSLDDVRAAAMTQLSMFAPASEQG